MDLVFIAVAVGTAAVLICACMIGRIEKVRDATWIDDGDGPLRRWNLERGEYEFRERK